ncbi:MAG: hypothetical protein NZM18_11165 [Thermoflexales bacterium]|nr:hypothetical protein [Thermoflexales bacterium]
MNTVTTVPTREADVAFDCPGNYRAATPSTLRCAKCDRPLAVKDAQRTPTGYVCPYYVKARVATFYTAGPRHYLLAALIAFGLGVGIGLVLQLVGRIGFFALLLTIFVGPAAGSLIAEAIRRANGKERGQYIWLVAAIATVIGAAYFTVLPALVALLVGSPGFIFALIPIVGLVLTVGTLIARLKL